MLPKRLESKIRNAIAKVQCIRDSIIHGEIKLGEEQAVVDEFDYDPVAFAARKYRQAYPKPWQSNSRNCGSDFT